jgi:hypothetical protein
LACESSSRAPPDRAPVQRSLDAPTFLGRDGVRLYAGQFDMSIDGLLVELPSESRDEGARGERHLDIERNRRAGSGDTSSANRLRNIRRARGRVGRVGSCGSD